MEFFKFFGSRAITLAFSIIGDIVLSGEYAILPIKNPWIAKLIISIAIIIINYITSKWLVFTKKNPNGEEK
jgi:putative flippase GtrA